ncbi:MAG: CHRD domain-containing protein [Actinomycetota bacterium]
MRKAGIVLVATVTTIVFAGISMAGGSPESTTLTGAEEVHPTTGALNAGDPDGSGTADLRLNQGQGTVCFELTWQNLSAVVGGHIHKAPAGSNGGIVVDLLGGPNSSTTGASGCVEGVARSLVKDIRNNSDDYYVNVHTDQFPGGPIRGQLGD